jgi:hypothetical protein
VTLVERGPALGGQLLLASRVPGRESIRLLIDDLGRDLDRHRVDVRLDADVTSAVVDLTTNVVNGEAFDGIVIATGAAAPTAASGWPAGTTLSQGSAWGDAVADDAIDAFSALARLGALGRRIAVVDSDGTAYASGVVLSLLPHVESLELVTPYEQAFPHVGAGYDRPLLLERLGAHTGFHRRVSHRAGPALPQELIVHDTLTGVRDLLAGLDSVVAIEPRAAVVPDWAEDLLDGADPRIRIIGDAVSPRDIDAAVHEAVELAYAVSESAAPVLD